tara:strand:+ start:307 stop:471 length:165 start_codon:yes stop_codon:yes gene_type:complete
MRVNHPTPLYGLLRGFCKFDTPDHGKGTPKQVVSLAGIGAVLGGRFSWVYAQMV